MTTQKKQCSFCSSYKNTMDCSHCQDVCCKACLTFVETDQDFQFDSELSNKHKNQSYCPTCSAQVLATDLNLYEDTLQRAKEILVFDISQSKETRLLSRKEKPIKIFNEQDRQVITLKMAYKAAQLGFNAIIDCDIKAKKIRDGSYQTTAYDGSCIPTQVSDNKLIKDRSIWSNPN